MRGAAALQPLHTFFIAVLVIIVAGCALTPPRPVLQTTTAMNLREAAELLDSQVRKCWKRDTSFFSNGVLIASHKTIQDTVRIAAVRYGRQIGIQKAFVIVDIVPTPNGVVVGVAEGQYECEIGLGCYEKDFAKDVPRWLSGDLGCKPTPGFVPQTPNQPLGPDDRQAWLLSRGFSER
ncbi:MAG: hypothetical protein ACXWC3_10105 [Burkholderiales bacterium]